MIFIYKKDGPSFLCKFFGAFKIKQTTIPLMPFTKIMCIMNNLFVGIEMTYVYDLKGSTYKRKTDVEKKKTAPTLKDEDFSDDIEYLEVSKSAFKRIEQVLMKDTQFLEGYKITDYSFLLGMLDVEDFMKDKKLEDNKQNLAMRTCSNADEKENQNETSPIILKTVTGAENSLPLP